MTNETTNNPLLCNPETGVCEIPNLQIEEPLISEQNNTEVVKIIYFTDPICSSCWGIEPQLRKLKLEYNSAIEIEYRMGGLLPDWSYNSGGISKPSDVAHHWDEVSIYYDMPIDGDIWLEDPLDSSYPPSIAFKAASLQDSDKALLFLRELREMVFLKKINIAKWENIALAAQKVGLDVKQLKIDFEGKAKILFQDDLKLARQYGVRGFPTLFFINNSGNKETVYGSQPYVIYEKAIAKIQPDISKKAYSKSWEAIFSKFETLTAREFSELTETPRKESEAVLHHLTERGVLKQFSTKNGAIWKRAK
ncbi:ClpXP adapter SpxH family protein [Flavobacterium chuncheonense]|uniref:ClpXP adapter SpxH family protein n=1 Tax=Flavobacterium chuncheonense TaxID=2026653 RepID=A0ABW5YNW8_9FLAO